MRPLNIITLILVIVGALNWGLVGLFDFDLVAAIFGSGSTVSRLVYVMVALSGLWQIVPLTKTMASDERTALRGQSAR